MYTTFWLWSIWIVFPFTNDQIHRLFVTSIDWQIAIANFIGEVHNHFPKSPLSTIAAKHKWIIPIITKTIPLANTPIYFTDANKTLKASYTGPTTKVKQSILTSVQQAKLEAIATLLGEGNGTPLQYSCLENPMDGVALWAAVHGVAKSRTQLSIFTFTFHFPALEKEMATHSSVLAWRIPGTGEPGGLPSIGSHRVGNDWSDLAAGEEIWADD